MCGGVLYAGNVLFAKKIQFEPHRPAERKWENPFTFLSASLGAIHEGPCGHGNRERKKVGEGGRPGGAVLCGGTGSPWHRERKAPWRGDHSLRRPASGSSSAAGSSSHLNSVQLQGPQRLCGSQGPPLPPAIHRCPGSESPCRAVSLILAWGPCVF